MPIQMHDGLGLDDSGVTEIQT
ncbi:hypothetical protein Avbf_10104 [Armadillidium vulgare]|nr:hypothetical protein Avbf_10104 [Armadillidium vulgare]